MYSLYNQRCTVRTVKSVSLYELWAVFCLFVKVNGHFASRLHFLSLRSRLFVCLIGLVVVGTQASLCKSVESK